MKSTAVAHSNIAFIKYWGRENPNINIPPNDSISLTKEGLDGSKLETRTTIEFSKDYKEDHAILNGKEIDKRGLERLLLVVNPLRELASVDYKFKLVSENDFPTAAGLASSASGYAAAAMAAADALGLGLSKKELSTYARLGSGSAARSIHGGIVHWHKGFDHETSYVEQISKKDDINLNAVIAVISSERKKVISDAGHETANKSIYNKARVEHTVDDDLPTILKAIKAKDFSTIGIRAQRSAMYMHAVMMTTEPEPLIYWEPATLRVIKLVTELRQSKELECYFSIDAGPNVHVLCKPEDTARIKDILDKTEGVKYTIPVKPAGDAYVTDKHLF